MSKDRITIEHRLTAVEGFIQTLSEDVRKIMTNHLPHLDQKINWIIGLLVLNAVLGLQRIDIHSVIALFH